MSSYKNPYVRDSHAIFENRNLTRPTADLLFKKELQESPEAVVHLLNNVLRPKIPFVSVTFRNVEIPADIVTAKSVRLDVLGHLNDGTNVDIEMQCGDRVALAKRAAFYLSRLVSNAIATGAEYGTLPRCVALFFIEDDYLPHSTGHSRYEFCQTHPVTNKTLLLEKGLPCIEIVELGKLKARLPPEEEVLKDWVDYWIPSSFEEWVRLGEKNPMFADLIKKVEKFSADEKLVGLQRAIDEGRISRALELGEAHQQGKEEGLAEGKAEGKAEGEADKSRIVAQNMLADGLPRATICRYLNISDSELTALLAKC
jgi:predicted transposase/invertase (TIGR01784 family)